MRLLDRYLLRELLVPLGYCLGGFLIFWVFADLFTKLDEYQRNKMLPQDVAEYYLMSLPGFLIVVLPVALLLALLYSITNHARHHEITAMRAAGLSLWRVCLPYLAVGWVFSLVLFALNEQLAPGGTEAAEQILTRRLPRAAGAPGRNQVPNLGFTNVRDGRKWQIGLYRIDTGEMQNPLVIWTQPDGATRWLSAERAARVGGVWTFYNVREHSEAPHPNALLTPSLQTNVLALPQFTETPEEIKSEISLARTVGIGPAKKADVPIAEILNYLRLHPNPSRFEAYWLHTKLQGRLAAPFTCLVVVLVAIPFGAASGRRNLFVGVASSIVICFAYFVLQQVGLALGTGGQLPPWLAAWAPNMIFGTVGIAMTARVR